jgi:hypothetical protein
MWYLNTIIRQGIHHKINLTQRHGNIATEEKACVYMNKLKIMVRENRRSNQE